MQRLVRLDDSTLGVIDRQNGRYTMLRVRRDTILTVGSTGFSPYGEDGCRLVGNRRYLAIPDGEPGNRITETSLSGEPVRSFAPIQYEGSPQLRETFASAAMGCDRQQRSLVLGSWHTG